MRLLASFSLVLLSFAPALPAQVTVPFRGGYLTGKCVLPITWEGKPAFLVITPGPTSRFLRYDYIHAKPFWTPSFRVAAGYFEDLRPCAPGSRVYIADDYAYRELGVIGASGTLTLTTLTQPLILASAGSRLTPAGYWAYYCNSSSCGNCPGFDYGPELAAMVLVME